MSYVCFANGTQQWLSGCVIEAGMGEVVGLQ